MNMLGFTLKKVDLSVWNFNLMRSGMKDDCIESFIEDFAKEYDQTKRFFKDLTGEKNLIWFRPWLSKSIELRSPVIDPLNVLEQIAIENEDYRLLRECASGIASGMLTTG